MRGSRVSSAGNDMGENDEEEEEEEDTLLGLGGHNSEASDEDDSVGEARSSSCRFRARRSLLTMPRLHPRAG